MIWKDKMKFCEVVYPNDKEFYISYIIVGVNPSSVCSGCSNTLINGDNCVVICPNNTYVVSYKDGGKGCRSCPD